MSVSREQLVRRAGVDDDYVRRLHELGAFRGGDDGYEERDVHVAALLLMWERAGLSAPAILAAVDSGTLSFDFLDSPAWELPEPLPITLPRVRGRARDPAASPSGHPGGDGVCGAGSRRPGPARRCRPGGARPGRARHRRLRRGRSAPLPRVRRQHPAPRDGRGRPLPGGAREAVGRFGGGRVGADAPRLRGRPSDGRARRANDPRPLRAAAAAHLDRIRRPADRDGARTSGAPGTGRVDARDLFRGHDRLHPAHRGTGRRRRPPGWRPRSQRS